MLDVVSDFNNVTADWDIQKCLMEDPEVSKQPESHLQTANTPQPPRTVLAADQNGHVIEQTGELVTNLRAGTWAAVAATPTNEENNIVVHQPIPAVRQEKIQQTDEEGVYVSPSEARVVWVKPQSNGTRLDTKMVSEVITQGPLYSIAYSPNDHAVCVIFQYPDHARQFLDASQYKTDIRGYGLLGPGYEILPGQGYSNEAELKRMEFPRNERRRLTFVRSALFCDGLTEEKFKKDIYNMVGEEHVDLVWLFNIGNGKETHLSGALANLCKSNRCLFRNRCCAQVPGGVLINVEEEGSLPGHASLLLSRPVRTAPSPCDATERPKRVEPSQASTSPSW